MPQAIATAEAAHINGIPLHAPGEHLPPELLRQRACTELLRQQALQQGLLAQDDPAPHDGATSAAATAAIEQLLEQALSVPEPSEEACRRYHAAHPTIGGARGERAHLRHILFAVTPGVNVNLLRQRAEALLLELRCADEGGPAFAEAAKKWSNCPSGAEGGDLGWLTREDCAPEFARDVFEGQEIGVLARLVHSRFGLHVVQVCARQKPEAKPFEQVHAAVAQQLRHQAWLNALRQYLQLLAGEAEVVGIDLDAASTPLVQ